MLNVNLVLSESTTSNVSLFCLESCSSITGLSPGILLLRPRLLVVLILLIGTLVGVVARLLGVVARLLGVVARLLGLVFLLFVRLPGVLVLLLAAGVTSITLSS